MHEAVDFKPVGPSTISRSGLGHADHEALSEPAGLTGGPVLLVHHTSVVVLTLLENIYCVEIVNYKITYEYF